MLEQCNNDEFRLVRGKCKSCSDKGKEEMRKDSSHFKSEFFIPPPPTICGIMVHCHHGSIRQLLGNQLLLGASATTHVLIIAGSLSIFSKNKGIAWQDNLMKPEYKRTFILLQHHN